MKFKIASFWGFVAIFLIASTVIQAKNLKDVEITDEFPLQRCIDTVALVTSCIGADCNQYLPLIVGRVWELDNEGGGAWKAGEKIAEAAVQPHPVHALPFQ